MREIAYSMLMVRVNYQMHHLMLVFQNLDSENVFILLDLFIHLYCQRIADSHQKDTVRSLIMILSYITTLQILTEMNYKA